MIKKPAEVGETNKKTVKPNYNTVLNAKNVKSNVSQTLDTSVDLNLDSNFSDIFKQSFMLLIFLSLLLLSKLYDMLLSVSLLCALENRNSILYSARDVNIL